MALARPSTTHPVGAHLVDGGVNFCLYSRHASRVELLLFDHEDDARPSRVVPIGPESRTYHYWHTFVPGLGAGQLYGYRVHGPRDPERGLRFDPDKLLLDPYAHGVAVPPGYDRAAASRPGDTARTAMKSVVLDPHSYDWEDDAPPRHPAAETLVHELHVRGFTRHESSGVAAERRGTFAGLIDKIPYLQDLGVTAVQLMPIFQFDAQDALPGRINYWGYSPVSFFAVHQAYASRSGAQAAADEFRDLVKALHRAGIEVILDVVYNHTAEGDHDGPTLSLRGIDNRTYYLLEGGGAHYLNYSGCGNTLRSNDAVVRRMVLDSLRYWVSTMHVDGFRFDLASVLARDSEGNPLLNAPILWEIESDPELAGTKLIAEAWDAGGLYQVGSFIGDAWKELNGAFRDDVRDFFRGVPGSHRRFADRVVGSPQVYGHEEREAEQSVNFVTCHDGFTLEDLVSYDHKHNEANGEGNRDGTDDNRSWNCGAEGPTRDPAIEALRNRQVKNFLATTLLSVGVPMLGMGDEIRRTQGGNNNAYCQDNETSWMDWRRLETHRDVVRFVRMLANHRLLRGEHGDGPSLPLAEAVARWQHSWHGTELGAPDWSDESHVFALESHVQGTLVTQYTMFNGGPNPASFELPSTPSAWHRWIDTSLPSPQDIVMWSEAPRAPDPTYVVQAHSVVALIAGAKGGRSSKPR